MRARYLGAIALAGAAALGAGCSGGDGPVDALLSDGSMSAMIGDTMPWRANVLVSARLVDSVLEIQGLERSGKFVKISVRGIGVDTNNADVYLDLPFAAISAAT